MCTLCCQVSSPLQAHLLGRYKHDILPDRLIRDSLSSSVVTPELPASRSSLLSFLVSGRHLRLLALEHNASAAAAMTPCWIVKLPKHRPSRALASCNLLQIDDLR
ncbi:hypothetical protein SLEP1_g48599 [Rubroshorea leprosula]|uniref:Uncharacterized protein n=1 Tax=Rubroshorea leprosula TaxID=152421 RepID=A0AAV5LU56_9ROSI|nr:hypothetical protein SLEP1_g48599 [Rubroshorea leprosula]